MSIDKEPNLAPGASVTIGDKYGWAMHLAVTGTQEQADTYFLACVRHQESFGGTRAEAEKIEKANIGYYAGYYSSEDRAKAEAVYRCAHPVLGAIAERGGPTPEEAVAAGLEAAARAGGGK